MSASDLKRRLRRPHPGFVYSRHLTLAPRIIIMKLRGVLAAALALATCEASLLDAATAELDARTAELDARIKAIDASSFTERIWSFAERRRLSHEFASMGTMVRYRRSNPVLEQCHS